MVPDDLRYTKDHEWVRLDGDTATVGITQYAADQLGDIVFVELPDVGKRDRAVRGVRRGRIGQGRQRPVRAAQRRGHRDQRRRWPASPEIGQQRPVRRWLDGPAADRRRRPARRTPGCGRATTTWSRPADRTMPYGPHTASDRERMLASLGLTSVDELFDDIPVALRASAPGPAACRTRAVLAARLQALAATNLTDLASFLGAGVYRHWTPPAVDQLLLRGEWYTAYTPYQPEVSQGTLQSIYEYESLIAELVDLDVVSRLALRRRRGDRRGGPHDVPGDPARAGPGIARRPPALSADAGDVSRGRPGCSRRSRS